MSFPPAGQCLVCLDDDSGHTVYICLVERLEGLRKAVKVEFRKADGGDGCTEVQCINASCFDMV